jgi:lipopolysaccharide export system permease protein
MLDIIHNRKPANEIELSKTWVLGKNNEIYFYNFLEKGKNRFVNFNILYLDSDFSLRKRLSARYATWTGPHSLELSDGFEREFTDQIPVRFARFPERRIEIAEDRPYFTQIIKFSTQMGIRELKRYIRFLKSSNSETARFEAQLYYNYAFPFSSLVMVLIAIPFSFIMGNKGTLFGIGVAIGISMAYWGILGVFSSLGSTAILSPVLSAFAPLVLFVTISIILLLNIKT